MRNKVIEERKNYLRMKRRDKKMVLRSRNDAADKDVQSTQNMWRTEKKMEGRTRERCKTTKVTNWKEQAKDGNKWRDISN